MDIVQQTTGTQKEYYTNEPENESLVPIAGVQALTTIDFPGKIAAVFFAKGCPWKCRYCHNPSLRDSNYIDTVEQDYIERFLSERVNFLEGIVVSGGEPTFQKRLPDFLEWVRSFGYSTAIHTNGFFPTMLQRVILKGLVDYIALDIKAPPKEYDRVTGSDYSCIAVSRSIDIILSSGIDYEFRTTYHPAILTENDLSDIVQALSSIGVKKYYLQRFRTNGVEDEELTQDCYLNGIPENIVARAEKLFEVFAVR